MGGKLSAVLNVIGAEAILIRKNLLRVVIPVLFIAFIQALAVSRSIKAFIGVPGLDRESLTSIADPLIHVATLYLAVIVSAITALALTGLIGEARTYGMTEHVHSSGQGVVVVVYGQVLAYVAFSTLIGCAAVSIFSLLLAYSVGPEHIKPEYVLQAVGLCVLLIVPATTLYCVANYVLPKTISYLIDFAILMVVFTLPVLTFFREDVGTAFVEALLGVNLLRTVLVVLVATLWALAPLVVLLLRGEIAEKSVLPQ